MTQNLSSAFLIAVYAEADQYVPSLLQQLRGQTYSSLVICMSMAIKALSI